MLPLAPTPCPPHPSRQARVVKVDELELAIVEAHKVGGLDVVVGIPLVVHQLQRPHQAPKHELHLAIWQLQHRLARGHLHRAQLIQDLLQGVETIKDIVSSTRNVADCLLYRRVWVPLCHVLKSKESSLKSFL
jgi:hypothetical protein